MTPTGMSGVQSFIRDRLPPSPALRERVAGGRVRAQLGQTMRAKLRPLTPALSPKNRGEGEIEEAPNERLHPHEWSLSHAIDAHFAG